MHTFVHMCFLLHADVNPYLDKIAQHMSHSIMYYSVADLVSIMTCESFVAAHFCPIVHVHMVPSLRALRWTTEFTFVTCSLYGTANSMHHDTNETCHRSCKSVGTALQHKTVTSTLHHDTCSSLPGCRLHQPLIPSRDHMSVSV